MYGTRSKISHFTARLKWWSSPKKKNTEFYRNSFFMNIWVLDIDNYKHLGTRFSLIEMVRKGLFDGFKNILYEMS